jgi:hypothetical protein
MSWLRYRGRWIKSLKSKIPVEEESELMKMMDDSRAIPNNNQTMIDPNIQELSKAALYNIFDNSKVKKIIDRLQENNQTKLHLDGLLGSAVSFVIRALFKKIRRSVPDYFK